VRSHRSDARALAQTSRQRQRARKSVSTHWTWSLRRDVRYPGVSARPFEGVSKGMEGLAGLFSDMHSEVATEPFRPGLRLGLDRRSDPWPERGVRADGQTTGLIPEHAQTDQFWVNRGDASRGLVLHMLIIGSGGEVKEPNSICTLSNVSNLQLRDLGPARARTSEISGRKRRFPSAPDGAFSCGKDG
jgi:hypothetical protein